MTRKHWTIALLLLLAGLGGIGAWYVWGNGEQMLAVATPPGETITADEPHTMGDRNAPVVLIEYAALTCPHCAEFNEMVFPALKEKYIQTGKVFYVFRLLPIGPGDFKAGGLAACMAKEKYLGAVDLLFRRQNEWGPMQLGEHAGFNIDNQPKTDAGLITMGSAIGLDAEKSRSCMYDATAHQNIERAAEAGATRYGISGVPSVIVNGQVMTTPHDAAELSRLLDPLLEGK